MSFDNKKIPILEKSYNKYTNSDFIKVNTDLSDLYQNNIKVTSINQNKPQRYIFFYKYLSDEINLFDTETEEIISVKVNIDNKWNQIEQLIIDDEGNTVICTVNNYDLKDKKYYYIKSLDILKNLEKK